MTKDEYPRKKGVSKYAAPKYNPNTKRTSFKPSAYGGNKRVDLSVNAKRNIGKHVTVSGGMSASIGKHRSKPTGSIGISYRIK